LYREGKMGTMIRAARNDEMTIVRELFLEYAESLGFSLCFQGFDKELAELPGKYGGSEGVLLLALMGEKPVGVVGLRKLEEGICEMKRLYVRPEARGWGLGRELSLAILRAAWERGYGRMRLDTLPNMEAARHLYEEIGFQVIPAYYDNSPCGSICMEKTLE
jgi:ribosomal protein S18 acetylase RimI-like enzyme